MSKFRIRETVTEYTRCDASNNTGVIKFASTGLMIQWGVATIADLPKNGSKTKKITFQIPFVGKNPIVQLDLRFATVSSVKRYHPVLSGVSLTVATIGIYNNGSAQSSGTNNSIYWCAYGRWK